MTGREYLLAASLESIEQLRLLRGKFGFGQNAPSMQPSQPFNRSKNVLMSVRSLARRGLLL
jgi:hypothetical protein